MGYRVKCRMNKKGFWSCFLKTIFLIILGSVYFYLAMFFWGYGAIYIKNEKVNGILFFIWILFLILALYKSWKLLFHEIKVIFAVDLDGTVRFQYRDEMIRFHLANEYTKKNLRVVYHIYSETCEIILKNYILDDRAYKIVIGGKKDFLKYMQQVCDKWGVAMKIHNDEPVNVP